MSFDYHSHITTFSFMHHSTPYLNMLPTVFFSHSADEGLRGRNVLVKSCSCNVILLESWRICPLAFLHIAMSLYDIMHSWIVECSRFVCAPIFCFHVVFLPYGRKFWRGIYFGGLAVLRAIRQYFICQKLHSVMSSWLQNHSLCTRLQLDTPV